MRELVHFPTPNWFISRPIDVDPSNGSLAITAINSIILTNHLFDEFNFTITDAHTKRLHAVAFAPATSYSPTCADLLLASCSEDFEVKIWNLRSRTLHYHHKLHQSSVTCIGWLRDVEPTNSVVVSGDLKGNIFKYNLSTSVHNRYNPESGKSISQMRTHSERPIAAVGYKHGSIIILDLSAPQLYVLTKLKSHEDAINCLIWTSADVLASSAEDRSVRVWRVSGQESGEEIRCFRVPGSSSGSSGGGLNKSQQTINYTPLCAPRPGLLLTASFKGELFYVDLEVEDSKWTAFAALSGDNQHHKKAIFDIFAYNNKIVTLSLDRLINLWDLDSYKQESSISTVNGFIYSISNSPIDPNLFAVSVGDSSIKLFNEKQDLKCGKSFNSNIKTEVTQVCWHPIKENIIAFGTKDGKVGLADIFANNKPAQYIFNNYNQSVYTLVWSEPLIQPAHKETSSTTTKQTNGNKSSMSSKKLFHLYSVADAKIMQHHVQLGAGSGQAICGANTQATNFYKELLKQLSSSDELTTHENNLANEHDKTSTTKSQNNSEFGLTELAVFDRYFAIGKYDGSIELYQKEPVLTRLATLFNHQKLITCIRCNPNCRLLASGSNDFNVIIVDLVKLSGELSGAGNQKLFAQFKNKLLGHKERITGLSWSQFDPQLLVSCSYDLTVQVWNAELGLAIANFRGHSEKLLCCAFSSIDPNVVFSGGEDYCLLRWRIDAQTNTTPPNECLSSGKKRGKFGRKHDKKKSKPSSDSADWRPKQIESKSSESDIDLDERADTVQTVPLSTLTTNQPTVQQSFQQDTLKIITDIEAIHFEAESRTATTTTTTTTTTAAARKPVKSGSPGQRDPKSLFVLSSSMAGAKSNVKKLNDCLKLFETLYEKKPELRESQNWSEDIGLTQLDFGDENQATIIRLFGNRQSVFHMLRQETAELRAMGYDKWWLLDAWKGDMQHVIAELRRTNALSDLAVVVYETAVNSTRSPDLLNAYIDQLRASGHEHVENVHKAVLLSLSLYQTEQAVRIYAEKDMYQYALCVAILRRAPQFAGLVDEVLGKYAVYATSVGDYETAVMCYLRLHDVESAFSSLLRRNTKGDEQCEKIVAEMSAKLNDYLRAKKSESVMNGEKSNV